ncbi:MAG: hypothetical protein KDI68_06720 [Gammaproteobacteria bacterium]|nr:hypothetical protein [Gammaproteobacteria bacterium]
MPYFVYQIAEDKQLEMLEKHEKYREARTRVRELRAEQPEGSGELIRLIHAGTQMEAERLLLTPREVPVEGDD